MAADSPFAIAPQHLSSTATVKKTTVTTPYANILKQQQSVTNTTVRGMQGAKPNIMLLLDDSGSMRAEVPGSYGQTRQGILRNSLSKIVDKYGSRINWGLVSFNDSSSRYNLSLGTSYLTVANAIRNFPASGTTPTITSYLKAVNMLNEGIKYRCQKSYVVLLSDGDSNWPMGFWVDAGVRRNTVGDFLYYPHWVYINRELNKYEFWRNLLTKDGKLINKSSPKYRSMCNAAYRQSNSNAKNWCSELPQNFIYYPYSGVSDPSVNFGPSVRKRELGYWYTESPLRNLTSDLDFLDSDSAFYTPSKRTAYGLYGMYPIFNYQPILAPQTQYAGEMLSFFSEPINKIDLRTVGNDDTGKSWNDPAFPTQNITTFTIGFGSGLTSSGLALLKGGASDIKLKDGTVQKAYYPANDQAGLQKAFDSIFDQIERENPPPSNSNPIDLPPTTNTLPILAPIAGTPNRQQSVMAETSYATSPPSATGASNSIPNMAASVFVPAGLKSSELRFYALNSKAQADTSSWHVADFSQRKALIMTSSGVRWADNVGNSLNNTFFNLPADTQTPPRTDEWNKALLPWTTRAVTGSDDSKIKDMKYPTPYRIRPNPPTDSPRSTGVDEYNMGDVLDTPIVATGKNGTAQGNRQEFLITAANDGMVYLFQSNPDANAKNPYSLKLNYLPATMPRQTLFDTHATRYKDLADEDYAKDSARPHLFMINGGITVRTTSAKSNSQNTFMVGALGQGGRGMYALNIGGKALDTGKPIGLNAESNTWNTSVPLYESNPKDNSADFSSLGYTVGYPQIGRVAIRHNADGSLSDKNLTTGIYYASFLSSGFSYPTNGSQETALYIQDALGVDVGGGAATAATANRNPKGKLLAKVVVPDGVGGLASPTLLDVNRDGVYDFAFAGDYGGNMYRFDLRKIDLSNGNVAYGAGAVKKIYSGSANQPITSAPAISMQKNGRYVVAFGTGSDMYASDYNSTVEQAVYGIYQRFNTSNLDPVNVINDSAAEAEKPLTASDLLEQTLTTTTATMAEGTPDAKEVIVRKGSTNAIESSSDKSKLAYGGWKVRLGNTTSVQDGERVVVTPTVIFGTLILSTRIYKEKPVATANNNDWSKDNWQADGWVKVSEKLDQNHQELPWSVWKEISTNSTSTTSSGDVCTGTVNTSTKMQEREKRVTYETITTYEKVQPSENQSSGWILVLNATNGGAVKVSSGTGVDFLGKYASNFNPNDTAYSNTYFTVGLYSSSGLPNHTLLTNDSNVHSLGSAMTRDGEARTNGEDGDLTPGGEKAKDDCFNNTDGNYVLTGNTATGIGATFSVVGRRCGKKIQIRRLSWREIF
ncbi:PilC protein [Kingella kingae ATCC 23330]|uniref:PilC protein n=3 Tax=Kingella kingae TaxID=504 RepID=F5S513_KINKI|nr:PilC protein [Kingella kingae ATCC 23330]